MIGQQTVTGYFTQVAILGQPLIWMWLYDSKIRCPDILKYYFYLIGFAFTIFVGATGVEIGFYTTSLFMQYALLTMAATFLYNQHNPIKEAVSLAFLTVFLNSFYWELPLHLAEVFSWGLHAGMIVQLWRLVPAVWLLQNYRFDDNSKKTLAKGLLFSLILNITAITMNLRPIIHPIIRIGCLLCLVKTIMEVPMREVK